MANVSNISMCSLSPSLSLSSFSILFFFSIVRISPNRVYSVFVVGLFGSLVGWLDGHSPINIQSRPNRARLHIQHIYICNHFVSYICIYCIVHSCIFNHTKLCSITQIFFLVVGRVRQLLGCPMLLCNQRTGWLTMMTNQNE